jgi:NitT/TauT family transport system substrate-binding protein
VILVRGRSLREPSVALVTDYSNGGDQVLVAQRIENLASLKGERIGVEVASLGSYLLLRALQHAELNLHEVEIVPCEPNAMADLMRQGKIAAAISYPPFAKRIAETGARSLFSSADIPGEIMGVVVVENSILRQRPEIVKAFHTVWDQIQERVAADPAQAYADMGRRYDLSGEEFAQELKGSSPISSDVARTAMRDGKVAAALSVTKDVLQYTGQVTSANMENSIADVD